MRTPRAAARFLARLWKGALRLARRRPPDPPAGPERLLLQEAEVTVPIAPGMAGKVAVRGRGDRLEVEAKAEGADEAFARGMRVRLIDFRDGAYLVEPADVEHLVR